MSVIKHDNYNRIEVNPLIEEHMLQMEDSEFSISQLTGHVTLKRENEYISKTKELTEKSTEIESLALSVQERYKRFSANPLDNLLEDVQESIDKAYEDIEYIENTLDTYEALAVEEDVSVNETDISVIQDIVPKITKDYGTTFSSKLKEIGSLLESFEKLDIIIDNESYFENYLNVLDPTYTDKDGNVQEYGLVDLINENKTNMDDKVSKTTYNNGVAYIKSLYSGVVARVNNTNGCSITGSYNITGGE